MKRTFLSVKELAHELGISQDSVYRAFRAGEIPGAQIARTIRFDLSKVQRAMEERAKAMPNNEYLGNVDRMVTVHRSLFHGGDSEASTR
jgi:excisionase family DNA binding protein